MRHGQTDWNLKGWFQGSTDIPLNSTGEKQAKEGASKIRQINVSKIFTSNLKRSIDTAKILCRESGLKMNLIQDPRFNECASERAARYVFEKEGLKHLPSLEYMDRSDETPDQFIQRVREGLIHTMNVSQDETPLIVGHGGVHTAICEILNVQAQKTSNCELVFFECRSGVFVANSK